MGATDVMMGEAETSCTGETTIHSNLAKEADKAITNSGIIRMGARCNRGLRCSLICLVDLGV